jgi:mono/diheme cytochrome c family protein
MGRHPRTEHAAAALVAVDLLRHGRLRAALDGTLPGGALINSATRGALGYSTRGEVENAIASAKAAQTGNLEQVAQLPLDTIAGDPDLRRFAVAGGRSAFLVNCVQCHGSGAAGSPGYPNLNDDDWLWGGTLDEIQTTITHGIRSTLDPETPTSEMPAFGADGILDQAQIGAAAEYVLSLSGAEYNLYVHSLGGEAKMAMGSKPPDRLRIEKKTKCAIQDCKHPDNPRRRNSICRSGRP